MQQVSILLAAIGMVVSMTAAHAQSAKTSIEQASATFAEKFNAKDAAGIAAHYAEDAVVLPPGESRKSGRAEIQKLWQSYIDYGVSDLKLESVSFEESGDIAVDEGVGISTVPGSDGKSTEDRTHYLAVWKKGPDGRWLIIRDTWNSAPASSGQ
jgi:uncharacterized protein (TIGR02246 family)